MSIQIIRVDDDPIDFDLLSAQITTATGLPVVTIEQELGECDELDALLRESLLHMHNLLYLLAEVAGDLGEHEYVLDATSFWQALRDGMCGGTRVDNSGAQMMCPDQAKRGHHFCESCLIAGGIPYDHTG
jgi:hypothetical protein